MKTKRNLLLTVILFFTLLLSGTVFAGLTDDGSAYVVEPQTETFNDKALWCDLYIPQGHTLITQGDTQIYGDIYVFGTLNNTGSLYVSGTLNCLNYSTSGMSLSAGNYSYGILKSTGTLSGKTLNVKDDFLTVKIPTPHTHNWVYESTTKETCFKGWYEHYYCSCGETKEVAIQATGHVLSNWKVIYEATCGDDGLKERECQYCYYSEEATIPATGSHNWGAWEWDEEPGCVSGNGKKIRWCNTCYLEQYQTVKPYGSHSWSAWDILEEPCCKYTGTACRHCNRCYEYQYKELAKDKNSHYVKKWKTTKKATALAAGKKTAKCIFCKKTVTQKIEKLKAKVTLKKTSISLKRKKSTTLKIKSKTYGDKIASWKSSDKKVATVNSKGKVTAKKKGTAVITLKMKSGATAICKVTVK